MNQTPDRAVDRHVGNRIAIRRITIGMSQATLAGKLGMTIQRLQDCEKGRSRLGLRSIVEIAGILGVNMCYFYDGLSVDLPHSEDPTAAFSNPSACRGH